MSDPAPAAELTSSVGEAHKDGLGGGTPRVSGIYGIFNTANGKVYVGQSGDCRRRKWTHLSALKHGRHFNVHLQGAFKKYGRGTFEFRVLEEVAPEMLALREAAWIAYYCSSNPERGYNLTSGGEVACVHELAVRKRLSEHQKELWKRPGRREAMRERLRAGQRSSVRYGLPRVFSEETRLRMSEAAKRRKRAPWSPEVKKKMSEAALRYIERHGPPKMSAESRRKQGESYRANRAQKRAEHGTSTLHQ